MPKESQFESFRLDPVNQCLWRGTDEISLSPKAFSVLAYLVERPGRLVTKQELLDAVWPDIHVTEGVLKRAVLEIRKALSDPADEPRYIQTLHRRGYRFLSGGSAPAAPAEEATENSGVVGRVREFQLLDTWFDSVTASSRQVIFISGEAGLGKSTLIDHWMSSLRRRRPGDSVKVVTARGRCLQQFGSGEPYLPVFEALEQLSQEIGRRLVDLLRSRAPTWLMHMPALISLEDRARLREEVFGSTRERMLREITDALEALSVEIPVVLAFEDLHWSDPSTIDLLMSIARRSAPARLMILGTYRPADAGGGSGRLLAAQNELELHRQCKVLPLAYLSEEETSEYLAARFPDLESTAALGAALHQRTNGNPLYVCCLADELARTERIEPDLETIRQMLPETLQQMFERQAAQQTGPEQEMLEVAAVAGEDFSAAGVAAALGWDPTQVESHCEALVRRQIILKRAPLIRFPDGNESAGYAFHHALCRDALYRNIPTLRRSRLHGLLGQADEALYASDPKRVAAELAGRFELAGDFPRAVQYLRMASDHAATRCSNQEAALHLDRALGMLDRLKEADQPMTRMDLMSQRAAMRMMASDLVGAVSDWEAVANYAREAGDIDREISGLLESVAPLLMVDYRRALANLDTVETSRSKLSDPALLAAIDAYRSFAEMHLFGWDAEKAGLLNRSVPQIEALANLRIRGRIYAIHSAVHCFAGQYAAACERAEEAIRFSRKTGIFFDFFLATLYRNWGQLHRGDLGGAFRSAREGIEIATRNASPIPQVWFNVRESWTRMEAFDFATPLKVLHGLAERPVVQASRHHRVTIQLWVGMALAGNGKLEQAWNAFEELRVAVEEGGIPFQVVCPLLNAQAQCALARQDRAQAKKFTERLIEVATQQGEGAYLARGHRLLAEIALLDGDYLPAAASIARAEGALADCEAWVVECKVQATAAQIYARLHRLADSETARNRSLALAGKVAATLAGEPALQQSYLQGIDRLLDARASTA